MEILTQPTLLLKPFAENGDKNDIPLNNETIAQPQLADLTVGFPPITSKDPADGGLPPERKDFNALGYLTTTYDYFYQAGGTFTFNSTISNAIGGYPLGARLWYTDSNGVSCILRSTIANNTNDFTQDDSVIGETGSGKPWEVENFRGINNGGILFDCKWSDHIINDISWLRADTFSWQSGSVYVAAYNHLVNDVNGKTPISETIAGITIYYHLADDGHKICAEDQESNVLSIYNATGVSWYYILDQVNQRFKLPRTKYGFVGLRDSVEKYVPESLPNIKGNTGYGQGESLFSGSFYKDTNNPRTWVGGSTTITNNNAISFDASLSSSAYQDNAPVQQRATQMYLYFYVGNYKQSAIEQTAGLNSELFNGKVDLDAQNLSNAGKSLIAGLGMPSGTYDNLTLGVSGSTYTAPANGWFYINMNGAANQFFNLINTTKDYGVNSLTSASPFGLLIMLPVNKGDIIRTDYNLNSTVNVFRFIYAKGSESEVS